MAAVLGRRTLNRYRTNAASMAVLLAACVVVDRRMIRAAIVTDRVTHPARQMDRQTSFPSLAPQRKQMNPRLPKTAKKLSVRKKLCQNPMRLMRLCFRGSEFVSLILVNRARGSNTLADCLDIGGHEDACMSASMAFRCKKNLRTSWSAARMNNYASPPVTAAWSRLGGEGNHSVLTKEAKNRCLRPKAMDHPRPPPHNPLALMLASSGSPFLNHYSVYTRCSR
jgi:hypothetical protein